MDALKKKTVLLFWLKSFYSFGELCLPCSLVINACRFEKINILHGYDRLLSLL